MSATRYTSIRTMQSVAACCSVLQRVAACCSQLQCVVRSREHERYALHKYTHDAEYCRVLQSVAVCCRAVQRVGISERII